jgi:hypothetical protein
MAQRAQRAPSEEPGLANLKCRPRPRGARRCKGPCRMAATTECTSSTQRLRVGTALKWQYYYCLRS